MTPQFSSLKTLLVACAAIATFGVSSTHAATIFPELRPQNPTVGNPLSMEFIYRMDAPNEGVEMFEVVLSYDPAILRPQRVTFHSELGDPDVRSAIWDSTWGGFIPDQFGAGDAYTIASYFGTSPTGEATVRFWERSLIFEDLRQVGYMTLFELTFDTLAPGVSPLNFTYELRGAVTQGRCIEVTSGNWQSCTAQVLPVPEPSTMLMILAGAPWVLKRMRRRGEHSVS